MHPENSTRIPVLLLASPEAVDIPLYQEVFGNTLLELARMNEKIAGITPAMPTGSSLCIMMKEIPDRVFDVGIAEQHAVTFSAGLATQGMIPFCNIYSSFMQRAYDQVIHDVALQNLHVVFCIDRGGLVGSDGATHHGFFDIAFMRSIPNMIVSAPMNEPGITKSYVHRTAREDQIAIFNTLSQGKRHGTGLGKAIHGNRDRKSQTD